MKYIIKELKHGKNFIKFALLKILGQGFMFLVPLLVAKFLAPEAFGAYALSVMIIYFFTALLINSSQTPFIVYASQELRERNKINKTLTIRLIILVFSVAFFGLLSILFIRPLSGFATITTTQFLFLFIAYLGMGIRYFFESIFLALNKRLHHAIYGIINGIISVAFILILYFFFKLTLENIFLMFLIAPALASLFVLRWIKLDKIFPLVFDKVLFKKMFDYIKWTMMGGTAIYFISWGDNLVLRYFVSISDIGVYNLGYQIFKGIIILISVSKMYFLPSLSQNINDVKKIRNYLYNKRYKIMALGSIILALIMIVLPTIFTTIYGEEYKDSIPVMMTLLISSFFVLYRSFYSTLFEALKRYKFTQLADVFFVTLNILLDIIFVIKFGMVGAAVATAITYIASAVAYEIYFRKYCKKIIGV